MSTAMIVVNPLSGEGKADLYVDSFQTVLKEKFDEIYIRRSCEERDSAKFAREACDRDLDALIVMGGDGTVHEVLKGFEGVEKLPALGILPLGKVNNFASLLGYSSNVEEAISQWQCAYLSTIDLARSNGQLFASSLTCGTLPKPIREISPSEKKRVGPLEFLSQAVYALGDSRSYSFELDFDGEVISEQFSFFMITSGRSLGNISHFFPGATLDDNKLHFAGIKSSSFFEKVGIIKKLFSREGVLSREGIQKDALFVRNFEELKIDLVGKYKVKPVTAVDGEDGPDFPLHISIEPSRVQAYEAGYSKKEQKTEEQKKSARSLQEFFVRKDEGA